MLYKDHIIIVLIAPILQLQKQFVSKYESALLSPFYETMRHRKGTGLSLGP